MSKNFIMQSHNSDLLMAEKIALEVKAEGGCVYYVGGIVRDRVLGFANKDVDIEVHGISEAKLREILDGIGQRIETGANFGIFGLKHYSIDIAMPRTERKKGNAHIDFDVTTDPFIGTYKAAARRDFTINALMQDVLTGEIVDHFGGLDDLSKGIIRHVNEVAFAEDPLRVLRAAQFAARFDFKVAKETIELCQRIDLLHLSMERIEEEMKKALTKSRRPSRFFEILREMKQLDVWFPEVKQLINVPQSMRFHREGDVWTHSMLTVDNAAQFVRESKIREPYQFLLAALVHDFGKIVTTEFLKGDYHAYEHEIKGLPLVDSFLKRITRERKTIKYVMNMTRLHMKPNKLKRPDSKMKSINKMFDESVCPRDLIYLAIADGMSAIGEEPFYNPEEILLKHLDEYEELMAKPYVTGKDLIEAGFSSGEDFKELLAFAHKLRLAGIEKEEALKQVLGQARSLDAK